jgi:antitoxin VapB
MKSSGKKVVFCIIMALNIKNREVERLAAEIARLTHTTRTEAIRQSLEERRQRLAAISPAADREEALRRFLKLRIWPRIPASASRRWPLEEEDAALGYGRFGDSV